MHTQLLAIDHTDALAVAVSLLAREQVLVAPTDTVYGLMARFDSPTAIEQLYIVKDRPPERAIPVLIGELDQLAQLTPLPLPPLAQALAVRFWPGPLTLVLPALPSLPGLLTARQPTVGIRLPDHPFLRELLRRSGPLAATSANLSGQPETHTAATVLAQLGGRVPLVLVDDRDNDTGAARSASTVVDVTDLAAGKPRLLRPGPLAAEIECFMASALPPTTQHSC